MLTVESIKGLPGVPSTGMGVRDWLKRLEIPTELRGKRFTFSLTDLPADVSLAYCLREGERAGLAMGVQDDAAHVALQAKPQGTREIAHERAAMLVFVRKHELAGLKLREIAGLLPGAGFARTADEQTLKDWLKRVEGVDPINWAPALAPDYSTKGRPASGCSPEAWDHFEKNIASSGRNGTGPNFKWQWGQTKAEADRQGWDWPRYRTVLRRWESLAVERQRTFERGKEAAAKSLTHFLPRSLEGMRAMEQAEVDFREFKVLCIWEDGEVGCPWVGLAVDRASSKVVGRSVARSENEEAVVDLIADMTAREGIPDRLVQDNGAAFNSLRLMGGQVPLVRRKDKGPRNPSWGLPGVYETLGIEVTNHGPRMAWAKLPESLNSAFRHLDNDPVFHRAQRTGPNDAPNPNPVPVPIALFRAALDGAIAALNANTESRAKGLRKGECRNSAFARMYNGLRRDPSPLQARWMRLKWHLKTVRENGQIVIGDAVWGDGTTQRAMLHYAEKRLLIGIDPKDASAPAMVYEWNEVTRAGKLLLENLPSFAEALHNDQASKRRAQDEKQRARDVVETEAFPQAVLNRHSMALQDRLMEKAGKPQLPRVQPQIVPLPKPGPLQRGPARHEPVELDTRAKTDLWFALKEHTEGVASGGNR